MNRSGSGLVIVALIVAAIFLILNNVVRRAAALADWWLIVLLLAVALLIWAYGWLRDRRTAAAEPVEIEPVVWERPAPAVRAIPQAAPVAAPPSPAPAPEPAVAPDAEVRVEAPAPVVEMAAPPSPAPAPEPEAAAPPNAEVRAAPPAPKSSQPDDLKVVEGIGPKFEKALHAAGIRTFEQLSKASEADLHAAVEAAGMRFAPSIPTWAEQAAYCARGDWDGLKAFQDTLKAGRRGK
jgi:predicted flap endonuclease-1-like 5' DNA nuclease